MLVQTPSKIFKADFASWHNSSAYSIRTIINEEKSGQLQKVSEVVLNESFNYELGIPGATNIIILVLYGEVLVSDFKTPIAAGQSVTLKCVNPQNISFKNNLDSEKADFLIFELTNKNTNEAFILNELDFSEKNKLIPISEFLKTPNFIGLFDGRKSGFYKLRDRENYIFGMVINGAFEFQNRLMENRDAILLWEIDELEFEALGENALILFFEV